jgi:hypothetical protein
MERTAEAGRRRRESQIDPSLSRHHVDAPIGGFRRLTGA